MLPESELEERVNNASFNEETEDSYGEIGNIIAGIYTNLFDQKLESQCFFDRKEHVIVDFPSGDSSVDQVLSDSNYYLSSSSISLDDNLLKTLNILLPSVALGLVEKPTDSEGGPGAKEGSHVTEDGAETAHSPAEGTLSDDQEGMTTEDTGVESPREEKISTGSEPISQSHTDRTRNDIDALLEICRVRIQEEVGDIVGTQFSCSEMRNIVTSKEQFFLDETKGKQVAVTIDVSGDIESSSYLYIGLKDAIRMGGTLLMLSPDELRDVLSEATLNPDIQDAYEEVTRVISSVYNEVFGEHYNRSLHFENSVIETIVPMKVDVESAEPIENQTYYLNRLRVTLEGERYGWLQTLFPTAMFGLENLEPELSDNFTQRDDEDSQQSITGDMNTGQDSNQQNTAADGPTEIQGGGNLLIIGDEDNEAKRIHDMLQTFRVSVSHVNFRDKINDYLPGTFQAVILLMKDVDEQSLGMAIKISASCSLPLIAIGSKWTRSKVLKALKYGVHDIILTPVTEEDLRRKITCYMTSMAA